MMRSLKRIKLTQKNILSWPSSYDNEGDDHNDDDDDGSDDNDKAYP